MLHPLIVPPQGLQFLIKYSFVPMIVRRDNFTNRKAVRFFNVTIWFESRSKPYHLPSKFYQTETKTDMITLSSKESVQWPYTERHSGSFIAVLCKTATYKMTKYSVPCLESVNPKTKKLERPEFELSDLFTRSPAQLQHWGTQYKINVVKVSKANYCLLVSFPRGLIAPRKT